MSDLIKRVVEGDSSQQLAIAQRQKEILKIVVDVNMLQGFRLDYSELEAWSKDIERLASGLTRGKLVFLMDCFKTNELAWDRNEGIQNIFKGLQLIYEEDGKLKLRKKIW